MPLSDGRILTEYLKDYKTEIAANRAGFARSYVFTVLQKPHVKQAILNVMTERHKKAMFTVDETAKYWKELATADARELNPLKYGACRYCWGMDNLYQFTKNEQRQRVAQHKHKYRNVDEPPMLDELGGEGYDQTRSPNEDCTECNGIGVARIVPVDLDNLSYGAQLLFDGIKVGKDGSVEFKLRNRSQAMEQYQLLMGYLKGPLIGTLNVNNTQNNTVNNLTRIERVIVKPKIDERDVGIRDGIQQRSIAARNEINSGDSTDQDGGDLRTVIDASPLQGTEGRKGRS